MSSAELNNPDRQAAEVRGDGAGDTVLRILSGGAANGLVSRLEQRFTTDSGLTITGDYGAVGGMRDRVVAGEPVDLVILTRALIDELAEQGHVRPDSVRDLGNVVTGLALRSGLAHPKMEDAGDLRALLDRASALYVPHTTRSTAGRHVASVLASLGFDAGFGGRLREFTNGQTAMAAMVDEAMPGAVGCTQITEILNTEGVDYIGDLPEQFALSTTYTAAVATHAAKPQAAAALIALLADPESEQARRSAGFT